MYISVLNFETNLYYQLFDKFSYYLWDFEKLTRVLVFGVFYAVEHNSGSEIQQ